MEHPTFTSRFNRLPTPEEAAKKLLPSNAQPTPADLDLSPAEVLAGMARDGEPIPTGFPPLDNRLRRGGIPPGRLLVVGGPPFAGKTTIVVDIGLHMSQHVRVFGLFSDEGRNQAVTRLGVMLGIPLERLDEDPGTCSRELSELMGERSISFRKPDHELSNIEDYFAWIKRQTAAKETVVVLLDSAQTIPVKRDMDMDERQAYKEFMRVCRNAASEYGWIVVITSQSNRASYKHRQSSENAQAIASFSGTGSIEYLADIGMVLSLPDESSEIVKVEMVKNRLLKTKDRPPKTFHVRYDSAAGRLLEVDEASLEAANAEANLVRLAPTKDKILEALKRHKAGLSSTKLAEIVRVRRSDILTALGVLQKEKRIYESSEGRGMTYVFDNSYES